MIDTPMLRRDLSGLHVDEAVSVIERETSSALDGIGAAPEIRRHRHGRRRLVAVERF
jgi:hypothetical protein